MEGWLDPLAGAVAADCEEGVSPNEIVLKLEVSGYPEFHRGLWPEALRRFREQHADAAAHAIVTGASFVPFPVYEGGAGQAIDPPSNVAIAVPALAEPPVNSLCGRFGLGLAAARELLSKPAATVSRAILRRNRPRWAPAKTLTADVGVAGAGTGGALAAIAAARRGARVHALDLLPSMGGIGSSGGIHHYFFGIKGGLQEELDECVRRIMPLFGSATQVRGFHPDAKKWALETMLREAGGTFLPECLVFGAECGGRRMRGIHAWQDGGALAIQAPAWIDATADGDLAAWAGCEFSLGRESDGGLNAYSQSAGVVRRSESGLPLLGATNFDAGFCDPTDVGELSAARLRGLLQYKQSCFDSGPRLAYIAPAIGLRQGRLIECDLTLQLADLIERRTFADAVGETGCHFDNHRTDYEFDSDEAMFWVWVCRHWRGRTACQIPYRILLPKALDNLWLGSRALGVSNEAHSSFRMQRDMQRIGEVAGMAAGMAALSGADARTIPFAELRRGLVASGALRSAMLPADGFGHWTDPAEIEAHKMPAVSDALLDRWIDALGDPVGGFPIWHLYRAGDAAKSRVVAQLRSAETLRSWRAAAILAMWEDALAEERLCRAVATREYGFDAPVRSRLSGSANADLLKPEENRRLVPHWMVSAALLRRCGGLPGLRALDGLLRCGDLPFNALTIVALTACAIGKRLGAAAGSAEALGLAGTILDRLDTLRPDHYTIRPQHIPFQAPEEAGQAKLQHGLADDQSLNNTEDAVWQLDHAIAKARRAWNLEFKRDYGSHLGDTRSQVRRAFAVILAPECAKDGIAAG